MGEFKGVYDPTAVSVSPEAIAGSQPLFTSFDRLREGGLVVLPDDTVAEIRHPFWHDDTKPGDLAGRTSVLPLVKADKTGIHWTGEPIGQGEPTLGCETELSVMHNRQWFDVSPDGINFTSPDGRYGKLADFGFDPEALKCMLEFKTDKAFGFIEHAGNMAKRAAEVERRLMRHSLQSPELSLHSEDFLRQQITELDYVRKVNERMFLREFGCMSSQLHVQLENPNAAQHALNLYQGVQAVFGLATAAAPIRDGSFDTTLGQHYMEPWRFRQDPDDRHFLPGSLDSFDRLRRYDTLQPYDWRELARVIGSASAGTFVKAAPVDHEELLRLGDSQLRDGSIVSVNRALGMHTDRLRWDKGTIEVCNLGTAGGNLWKKLATHEVVAKYLVAAQLQFQTSPYGREASQAYYAQATERGHYNNIRAALFGKGPSAYDSTMFIGTDGHPVSARHMLQELIDFTNEYSPAAVSLRAESELLATLAPGQPPTTTVSETFQAFFEPGSRMTATDALRHAHQLEPDRPVNDLLEAFARYRREHIFAAAES